MTDLETALGEMLHVRSADISSLPAHLANFDPVDLLLDGIASQPAQVIEPTRRAKRLARSSARPRRMPRLVLPIAAGVVAVVAVAGLTVAIARVASPTVSDPGPEGTGRSSSMITGPSPHITRHASLDRFGFKGLAGYVQHLFESNPGYRVLSLRSRTDTGIPVGCNGCESASDYVYVFDSKTFDATKYRVTSMQQLHLPGVHVVGGHAYLGEMVEYPGGSHSPEVATLAWQFASGRWALVQGVTAVGEKKSALLAIAAAVEPTVDEPVSVPFHFGYLPNLPLTSVSDDRSEGYACVLSFGSSDDGFDVTLWPQDPHGVPHTAAYSRIIGGVTGYYDPSTGVADIPLKSGYLELGLDDMSASGQSTRDRQEMQRVLAELTFSQGDGSAPYFSAEAAIP